MALPKFLQPYLASYDLKALDKNRDKDLIITEVLNKGDKRATKWLLKTYTTEEIKKVLKRPLRGMWFKWVLDRWLKYFNIKIPKFTYELALFSLTPRWELTDRFFREQERKNIQYHQSLKESGLNSF